MREFYLRAAERHLTRGRRRSTAERLAKSLIIDTVMSIQDGQHPRVTHDLLENYLPNSRRDEERRAA